MTDSIAAAQEGRVRLLVFDNCQHVRDAAADLIEAILAQSAAAKVLATSREDLGLADEQLWPVPSLDVGAGIDSAAVNLFVERAHSVAPDARWSQLMRRKRSSRFASASTDSVGDRTGGLAHGVDDRERGSRSSRSPVPAACRLAARLGTPPDASPGGGLVLRSPRRRGRGAAGAVFGVRRWIRSPKRLRSRRIQRGSTTTRCSICSTRWRKSLLVADRSTGRTRFSKLETIRQFAEEQLISRRAADQARAAHARHFAGREADIFAVWDSAGIPRRHDHRCPVMNVRGGELGNFSSAPRRAPNHVESQ